MKKYIWQSIALLMLALASFALGQQRGQSRAEKEKQQILKEGEAIRNSPYSIVIVGDDYDGALFLAQQAQQGWEPVSITAATGRAPGTYAVLLKRKK